MRERAATLSVTAAALGGLLALLSMGGCSGTRAPEPGTPRTGATAPSQPPVSESKPVAPPVAPVEKPAVAMTVPEPVARPEPAPAPMLEPAPAPMPEPAPAPKASPPPPPAANNGKREEAAAPVAKPAPPVAKPAPAPKSEPAPPPKPPALDLATLEKRLKETGAIGLMTKLALKNQVDELLDRFRAHYDGRVKTTVAQLRQPYDMLILKVLSLLQDGDPSLAKAIADSREAIWAVLTDPAKFRNL